MVFKPLACKTRWEGLVLSCWIALIDLLLLLWIFNRTTDRVRFVLVLLVVGSIPVLLHLLYRTWSLYTLEYWVDRNAITVAWANVRQIIPLHVVQRVVQGDAEDLTHPQWMHWPGPHVRQARTQQLVKLDLLATRPLHQCLLLDTGDAVFALSPSDEAAFLVALQERFQMGPAIQLKVKREQAAILPRLFGENQIGLTLVGLGLVGVLALFGLLMFRFPGLPAQLPFRSASAGLPEVVNNKSALFLLPGIGLLAWLINGAWGMWMVYRKQLLGAYMLWGGAIIVQICSLLALKSLLP
jgi:hypothetical protein